MLRCRSRKRRHLFYKLNILWAGAAENVFVFGGLLFAFGETYESMCFFGYRATERLEELKIKVKVKETVEYLIEKGGVIRFFLAVEVNLMSYVILL